MISNDWIILVFILILYNPDFNYLKNCGRIENNYIVALGSSRYFSFFLVIFTLPVSSRSLYLAYVFFIVLSVALSTLWRVHCFLLPSTLILLTAPFRRSRFLCSLKTLFWVINSICNELNLVCNELNLTQPCLQWTQPRLRYFLHLPSSWLLTTIWQTIWYIKLMPMWAITILQSLFYTTKNTVISSDFLVWKQCHSIKFPHQESGEVTVFFAVLIASLTIIVRDRDEPSSLLVLLEGFPSR